MCDGSVHPSGFIFCTDSYSQKSIQILIIILKNKFDLNCSVHTKNKEKKQYRIYIPNSSMNRLRSLVKPYLHPSFDYKLNYNYKYKSRKV